MRLTTSFVPSSSLRLAAAIVTALGFAHTAYAQQAPQVLPFTMSTFAGSHVAYTAGAACANGIGIALDTQGDGCLANSVSIGIDPHDVRVDGRGNVFYLDNAAVGLIHKINGQTGLETIYAGSPTSSKVCAAAVDTAGDGCPANDGAANNTSTNPYTSTKFTAQRGFGLAPNGDLFVGGYKDFAIHKISAGNGLMTIVAGVIASAGTTSSLLPSPATTTGIGASRGVGADAAGNFYIADTALNVIQMVTASTGQIADITAPNTAGTKLVTSGVLATTAMVDAPEDVQVDINGNIIIADQGNAVVRAIYSGKGTFFGIPSPQAGFIYTIAGGGTGTYTQGGGAISTAVLGTSIAINVRKLSPDNQGNIYFADTSNGYVWFIDAQTGYMRLLVGNYGVGAGVAAGCTNIYNSSRVTDTFGDFCPGPFAELYGNSNVSIGVSADNQGNIYISDPENGIAANSRIRKDLSGLNFATSVALGSTGLQTIDLHFGPLDTFGSVTLATGDFTAGTQTCVVNADTTSDCTLPITFKPTKPGYETAGLSVTSTLGGKSTYTVTATATASTIAVDPGALTATTTSVSAPQALAYDGNGNTYIADTSDNRVLRVTSAGVVSTFAGTGTAGNSGDTGLATAATLNAPAGLAMGEASGVLYIADTGNNTIRQVNLNTGIITTIAGGATTVCTAATNTRGDYCLATAATLSRPRGLAVDKVGVLYIADSGNNVIRSISTTGYINTIAGGATAVCAAATDTQGDGCAAAAVLFSNPTSIAYDLAGNYLMVADTGNNIVRKIYLGSTFTIITSPNIASATINPLTLIAGNGQAGSTVDSSGVATNSQLNGPTGIAVDAAENVYIADTANHAVRLVNNAGSIYTITGIVGTSGASTPGVATDTLLNSPSAVAVLPNGQLYIADAANNRVLADNRTAVGYNFGRVSPSVISSAEVFSELSIGNVATSVGATAYTATGNTADFALTATSTAGCSASTVLKPGALCNFSSTFTPAAVGVYTAAYALNAGTTLSSAPVITLNGTGAILTTTTPVLTQIAPATGNAQYGGSLTLGVTVSPATCNSAAPSCFPTGTVRITVDGTSGSPITLSATATASQTFTGLSVGTHTVTCSYSGDIYYAASSCASTTITVAPAATISVLTISANNQPQFTPVTLTATVTSSTIGIPTGTVAFYDTPSGSSTPILIGSGNINSSNGIATFTMAQTLDANGNQASNTTLLPGTYSLTCTYTPTGGANANYAASNCSGVSFTVAPSIGAITILTRGCSAAVLGGAANNTPTQGGLCSTETFISGTVAVSTADGSTTDATMFITPTNTVSGPLTFSCTGLPTYGRCTFSPSSYALTPGTSYVAPIPVDVTLWTDVKDASLTSSGNPSQTAFAAVANRFGWPLALLGFAGLFAARRRFRNFRVLAVLLLLAGSSMVVTGCAGVGNYTANLTPAGTFPVVITVKAANGVSATTTVDFIVTSPGITGIQ